MIELSACVIVKDEEKNIGQWLQCMGKLADEIIVVDTGSTDATREIVKKSGASLYDFPWQQDFAAAKNHALSKAKGKWIAFLDADEYFSEQSMQRIPMVLKELDPQVKVAGIMCRLVNIDVQDKDKFIGATVQVRLFRNLSSLRYQGRIHEALTIPKNRTVELVREIEIIHTGYSASVVQRKLRRNLELLQQKITDNDNQPTARDCRYLMDCYYGLADYPKAVEYAERALAQLNQMKDAKEHLHMIRVSAYLFGKHTQQEVLQTMDEAIEACPQVADFLMMKGLYLYEHQDYLVSESCIQQALDMREGYKMDVEGIADNLQRFLPSAYWVLGRLAAMKKKSGKASEYYLQTLRIYPYHTASLRALVKVLEEAGAAAADIIGLLQSIYKDKDIDYIAETLKCCGGDVFLYYASKSKLDLQQYEYLAVGRPESAAAVSADNLTWIYQCGICDALTQKISPENSLHLLLPKAYQDSWQALWNGSGDDTERTSVIVRMRQQWREQLNEPAR